MPIVVMVVLIVAVLALNFTLWKRRASGWRRFVDDFIGVIQPKIPEPVQDVIIMEPAGWVGRQARSEQLRGLNVLFAGLQGPVAQAIASHKASEAADAEPVFPPYTALALTPSTRYLLPVTFDGGGWAAGAVEREWPRGAATFTSSPRGLTVQIAITLPDWRGDYEIVRDPAKYGVSILEGLEAGG